ncbi:MAG TPA: alpha/beta hydrolase [Acetobacteraceae bacterium]|nr:alpha/beta hydrolase [Acetobacteraceae bacterium]
MASWQAHALDALLRATIKRRLKGKRDIAEARAVLNSGNLPFPHDVEYRVDWVGGIRGERITAPATEQSAPSLLYLHGGGYFACAPRTHRPITAWFAKAGFSAFAPDYRLAPEHRFPAAVEDAEAAYLGLLDAGTQAESIVVAGDSAGGGLALALLLRLRERQHRLPAGIALFSPWTDLALTGASMRENVRRDAMFQADGMPYAAGFYLGGVDARTPLASPLYGDVTGMPPLYIDVGERELLRDDSTRLAEKARAAGVVVSLRIWPVVPHVWQLAHRFVPEGRESLEHAAAHLHAAVRRARGNAPRLVTETVG